MISAPHLLVFISRNALHHPRLLVLVTGKLITLEAMSGLSKVLLYLDKKNVHLLVVYIFMKIKPFLECVRFIKLSLTRLLFCVQTHDNDANSVASAASFRKTTRSAVLPSV